MDQGAIVKHLTGLLRESDAPIWVGVRRELRKRGFEPERLVVATSFPDDHRFEFGIVVTRDGRVFQYGYDYNRSAEDSGQFTEWQEQTDHWQGRGNAEDVRVAMSMLIDQS